MEDLKIELLGDFRLEYEGNPVAVKKARVKELLAYLVLNRGAPQSRQYISFQFWPDSTEKQARTNLRNVLYQLRKILPGKAEYILADNKTLQWNTESSFRLDVAEFEKALKRAARAASNGEHSKEIGFLREASRLYKGELLITCYNQWIESERKRLHQEYVQLLKSLVELYDKDRAYDDAIYCCQRLIEDDPFDEAANRKLMKLYALNNERMQALQVYQKFSEFLEKELEVDPSVETRELYEQLLSDEKEEEKDLPYIRGSNEEWKFVGRTSEWNVLLKNWKQVLAGSTRFVLLSGEPGIGKSRLVHEFKNYLDKQGYRTVYSRLYNSAETISYGLAIDCLREQNTYEYVRKMDRVWLRELVRILPELKIDFPDLPEPLPIDKAEKQSQFLGSVSEVFLQKDKPIALFFDDLQWCDPESVEWLNCLFHHTKTSKLLVVGSIRPTVAKRNKPLQNFISSIRQEGRMDLQSLEPLKKDETKELTGELAGRKIDENLKNFILEETEGNPLFVVEYMREGLLRDSKNTNSEPSSSLPREGSSNLPERVEAVIAARFQYLSDFAWEIKGLAACIGREFSAKILEEACRADEEKVTKALDELLQHRVIREKGSSRFDFSHDKLREVSYAEISDRRKRLNHRRIAKAIDNNKSPDYEEYFSSLGFHYERAGNAEKAVKYYTKAAERAKDIFSKRDVEFYKKALSLIKKLPGGKDSDELERELQTKMEDLEQAT